MEILNLKLQIIIFSLIVLIFLLNIFKTENFSDNLNFKFSPNDTTNYEKDRTKLYGSLFLDNLDKVVKNMTDPSITYDEKRLQLLRYQDVLF